MNILNSASLADAKFGQADESRRSSSASGQVPFDVGHQLVRNMRENGIHKISLTRVQQKEILGSGPQVQQSWA